MKRNKDSPLGSKEPSNLRQFREYQKKPGWCTVTEVMENEGVTIHTVYRAINNNRIVAKDFHYMWLIDTEHESYKEWIAGVKAYQESAQVQGIKDYWKRKKADVNRT